MIPLSNQMSTSCDHCREMNAQHAVVKPLVVLVSTKNPCRKAQRSDIAFDFPTSSAKSKYPAGFPGDCTRANFVVIIIVTAVTAVVELFDAQPNRLISRGDVKKVKFKFDGQMALTPCRTRGRPQC